MSFLLEYDPCAVLGLCAGLGTTPQKGNKIVGESKAQGKVSLMDKGIDGIFVLHFFIIISLLY
jgi:hypothetical protein